MYFVGSSGGPLLDSSGRVVGMNTATFSRQGLGQGSGVNFALPIDMIRSVVPKLIVYGQAGQKRI
jgi:S1-C subfamily serine protease